METKQDNFAVRTVQFAILVCFGGAVLSFMKFLISVVLYVETTYFLARVIIFALPLMLVGPAYIICSIGLWFKHLWGYRLMLILVFLEIVWFVSFVADRAFVLPDSYARVDLQSGIGVSVLVVALIVFAIVFIRPRVRALFTVERTTLVDVFE